jgi:hypothetical protein
MGYARRSIVRQDYVRNDLGRNLNQRGYSHKLCPWSQEYRERFKYEGEIVVRYVGNTPVYESGVWVVGNSVDESFKKEYGTYECSPHTTTSGRMEYYQNPPGWICRDPNCYHYTTVTDGERYREV